MDGKKMLITVVSPFYNESLILEKSVELMLSNLSELKFDWEFIIVNDGSTDDSHDIAETLVKKHGEKLRLISYPINQGRGYALKQGIDAARGNIIVTTEIDSSWGDTIVPCLVDVMVNNPNVDIVVASPHLPGGGYRNVPFKRTFLSSWGNRFIRLFVSQNVTMYTGMTRAYRAHVIKTMPVTEKEKEFHLEVLLKAMTFGYKIAESPCFLEWKDHKLQQDDKKPKKRKSSSNISKLIVTHLQFGLLAKPARYLWGAALGTNMLGIIFFISAVVRLLIGKVAIFLALTSGSLMIISLLFFIFGVLSTQNSMIQKEIWKLQQDFLAIGLKADKQSDTGQTGTVTDGHGQPSGND